MARKRGNGEGSIYFSDKLNRWVGQFTAGVKNDGKPNRKSVYGKTRKEVAEKINKALNEIKEHKFVDKSDVTLYDLIFENIEDKFNANKTSPATHLRDIETLKKITSSPYPLHSMKVQKIKNTDIKKFFSTITSYSNSTIDKIYRFINSAFKKAVAQQIIYMNPLDNRSEIIKPKSDKPDKMVESLTLEEQKKLVKVLNNEERNHKYRNIIMLMLYTGMRVGETLALTRTAINLKEETISIKVSLTKDSKGKVIMGSTTKTYNSIRTIKMISVVKDVIDDSLKAYSPNMDELIFFDSIDKSLISPVEVNCYLKRICKKYDIAPHIHNHMLRHTYATRCIESGMTAVVLAKKLGHKDVSITLNTYTSVFSKFEETQDDKYTNYLITENLI